MKIDARTMHFKDLNIAIREADTDLVSIDNCMGQRYIGSGLSGKRIMIHGTPGNALGAYLNGSTIQVFGNAQDAAGDTMNKGTIYIHGNSGDATGYAMRGGKIFIEGNTGYRAGIHMKAYQENVPILVVGGAAGSFLGEYQSGGTIIILGLDTDVRTPVGYFCGTGMHGGKIYLRCDELPKDLPKQVSASGATEEDMQEITPYIDEFCNEFGRSKKEILEKHFWVLTPNSSNPYKQLYTKN